MLLLAETVCFNREQNTDDIELAYKFCFRILTNFTQVKHPL